MPGTFLFLRTLFTRKTEIRVSVEEGMLQSETAKSNWELGPDGTYLNALKEIRYESAETDSILSSLKW